MPVLWGNDVPELNEFHANNLLKAGVQGEPGGYYKIYEKNRISEKEIKELLQDTKDFEYRIENNMLCAKWIYFGDCCRPIFRNPEGTPEENNQYFLESYEVVSLFSTADDLAKLVETKSKKEETFSPYAMKWTSDDDGLCMEGLCIRKNPPAFSFKYPPGYNVMEYEETPYSRPVCKIRDKWGVPEISVQVGKIDGDFNQHVNQFEKYVKKSVEIRGSAESKIMYSRSLPTDVYGKDYPAQEYEIEFLHGGQLPLILYGHIIAKDDYYISLIGVIRRYEREDIEKVIKPIFHSINLEP